MPHRALIAQLGDEKHKAAYALSDLITGNRRFQKASVQGVRWAPGSLFGGAPSSRASVSHDTAL